MRTFKVILVLVIFYFITSCGLLQETSKTTNKDSQEFAAGSDLWSTVAQQKNQRSQSFSFYSDSTNHGYQVQLWPKGQFKYSAAGGFEGEAAHVLITGNLQGIKKGGGSAGSTTQESAHSAIKAKSTVKGKSVKLAVVKKSAPSVWWILGSLAVLGIVSIYYLKPKF